MRRRLVVANFKLHFDRAELTRWADAFLADDIGGLVDVGVAPSATLLAAAVGALAPSVRVFAQDVSAHDKGAYTGETSVTQLADVGVRGSLVGHSERRLHHGETDATVRAKVDRLLGAGLAPLVCVGETLAQRESGETESVVCAQVSRALAGLASLRGVTLAYEPVWAIGTGRTATPDDAQSVHARIRAEVRALHGAAAESLRILYGGSVKAENAGDLMARPDIDGALVGGASLDAAAFLRIVRAS